MDKNLIRHKTLGILTDRAYKVMYEENIDRVDVRTEELDVSVKEMWETLKISEEQFRKANVYPVTRKEVEYIKSEGEEKMFLNQSGIDAYEDNKYLKVRNNEIHERFYRFTKWFVPAASLIVAFCALYFTVNQKKSNTTSIYIQLKEQGKTPVQLDSLTIRY